MNFPNVWPDGGLFVFSGLDGETSWRHPLHAVPVVGRVGFDLYAADARNHVHRVAVLSLPREHGPGPISGGVVLNDAAHLPAGAGGSETIVAWLDRHTLVGWAETGKPSLSAADGSSVPLDASGVAQLTLPDVGIIVLHLGPDGRFALAYDEQSDRAALDRARAGIDASPRDLLVSRAAYQARLALPDDLSPDEERLARKAAAVLKANVESPQGAIARRWTTPDRLPHRNMWLWDSAFHALGLVYFDPALAQDAILAPLSRVRPDGMLAHMMAPDPDFDSDITQPPILAWAAWKVYQSTRDAAFLEAVYEPAARYLTWDLEHRVLRDSTAADLLGWLIDDDPLCRCGESGLDNSPRFDQGDISGAVDFSAEAALEAESLARIAQEIGRTGDAERWRGHHARISVAVERLLWDDSRAIYRDLAADLADGFNPTETAVGFFPLAAGMPSPDRAGRLVATLTDPSRFWRPAPVPTTAADDPNYSDDMWRGPTWVNLNYIIIEGLRRCGFPDVAHDLSRRTLQAIMKGYLAEGVLFEFFDSEGARLSGDLRRKGGPGRREASALGVIRDYGWTAAVALRLLMEGERSA